MKLFVHRVNFFKPKPEVINCLAYDESITKLALSRADFSIEIWDVEENPYLEKIIPGHPSKSVESLTWCNGRLFSAGLHSFITEHDLISLEPRFVTSTPSPIWCIGVNNQKTNLAAGSETGHIILYKITIDGLDFLQHFEKQHGRILCLSWHKNGNIIASGSINTIRIWDVPTGKILNRITLARPAFRKDTTVWCIAITSDMTIISGDSRGILSFWDGKNGTLNYDDEISTSDILALCVNEEENILYTSGIDHIIVTFIKSKSTGRWISSTKRFVHSHDVRALQIIGEYLASGGVDCDLVLTKYPPRTVIKCSQFSKSFSSLASKTSCLLLRYSDYLEIWKLQNPSDFSSSQISTLPLGSKLQYLVKIKSKNDEKIISSAISPDGNWLAYSVLNKLRLFYFEIEDESTKQPSLHKVPIPESIPQTAKILVFASEIARLVMYAKERIYIIKYDLIEPKIAAIIEDVSLLKEISLLELSPNNNFLACGTVDGKVIIYDFKTQNNICQLPNYKFQPTLLKFTQNSDCLFVVYKDRKIVHWSLKDKAYTSWSNNLLLEEFHSYNPIIGGEFFSNTLILHDENALYSIRLDESVEPKDKRFKSTSKDHVDLYNMQFKKIDNYKNISSIHKLSEQEIVIIEINMDHKFDVLPPPSVKKYYGT